MSSPSAPAARGRRLRQVSVLLMVLGVLLAGIAVTPIVPAFTAIVGGLTGPVYTAPFTDSVSLRRGKYLILESVDSSAPVVPDAVQVIDSAGNRLTGVRTSSGNDTISRGRTQFVDVVEFTTSHRGRYLITVVEPPNARLIVSRDPGDAFTEVAGWITIGAGGLLVALLGLVLLLVAISRKPQPAVARYGRPPVPQLPPPGWYPDPGRPTGWRYWDGYRWQP